MPVLRRNCNDRSGSWAAVRHHAHTLPQHLRKQTPPGRDRRGSFVPQAKDVLLDDLVGAGEQDYLADHRLIVCGMESGATRFPAQACGNIARQSPYDAGTWLFAWQQVQALFNECDGDLGFLSHGRCDRSQKKARQCSFAG
jgi:hypothetical protein